MKSKVMWAMLAATAAAGTLAYAQMGAPNKAQTRAENTVTTVCDEKDGKINCRTAGGSVDQQSVVTDCKKETGMINCRTTVR